MSAYLVHAIGAHPTIKVQLNTEVVDGAGDGKLELGVGVWRRITLGRLLAGLAALMNGTMLGSESAGIRLATATVESTTTGLNCCRHCLLRP